MSTTAPARRTIRRADLVDSVAAALQFISYYHPKDFLQQLGRAYAAEQSPAAKDAIAQILTNSRLCAEGRRPICQDTGIVNVFVKAGMALQWDGFDDGLEAAIDEGVPAPVLSTALTQRFASRGDEDFANKLLSAMRYEFGGHEEKHS